MEENMQSASETTPASMPAETKAESSAPLAALAYLPVLFIITMMQKGKDEFYMWHAKMGAVSTIIFVIVTIFWKVFYSGTMGTISYVLYLLWLVFALIGALKAWKHGKLELPGLTQFAAMMPLEKFVSGSKPAATSTPMEPMASAPAETVAPVEPVPTPVEQPAAPTEPSTPTEVVPNDTVEPAKSLTESENDASLTGAGHADNKEEMAQEVDEAEEPETAEQVEPAQAEATTTAPADGGIEIKPAPSEPAAPTSPEPSMDAETPATPETPATNSGPSMPNPTDTSTNNQLN